MLSAANISITLTTRSKGSHAGSRSAGQLGRIPVARSVRRRHPARNGNTFVHRNAQIRARHLCGQHLQRQRVQRRSGCACRQHRRRPTRNGSYALSHPAHKPCQSVGTAAHQHHQVSRSWAMSSHCLVTSSSPTAAMVNVGMMPGVACGQGRSDQQQQPHIGTYPQKKQIHRVKQLK